jgi:hypothetical protein
MKMSSRTDVPSSPTVYVPRFGQPEEYDTPYRHEVVFERWTSPHGWCSKCDLTAVDSSGQCSEHND